MIGLHHSWYTQAVGVLRVAVQSKLMRHLRGGGGGGMKSEGGGTLLIFLITLPPTLAPNPRLGNSLSLEKRERESEIPKSDNLKYIYKAMHDVERWERNYR